MDKSNPPTRYGVFVPAGHVVVSFPDAASMVGARMALIGRGVDAEDITTYTDAEMRLQAEADLRRAGPMAAIGQELNLVRAQRDLANAGYHFLVVACADDDEAQAIADTARLHRAERAQHYGTFVIEELIAHANDGPQVAESPDRGLDAQTRSGRESERAQRAARHG